MKKWYHSKTLWVNGIALLAILLQAYAGFIINPDEQVAILAVVNVILRFITKESIYEKAKPTE